MGGEGFIAALGEVLFVSPGLPTKKNKLYSPKGNSQQFFYTYYDTIPMSGSIFECQCFTYFGIDNGSGPAILGMETITTDNENDTYLVTIDTKQIDSLGAQIQSLDMNGNAVQVLPTQTPTPPMFDKNNIKRIHELCLQKTNLKKQLRELKSQLS